LRICIDTNILIDVLKDEFREWQEKFYKAISGKESLISPCVVYAELMPQFGGDTVMLNEFLADHNIRTESVDLSAATEAAKRWMKYLKVKSRKICNHCGKPLEFKEHFLSDFYIGGFALSKCDAILTRDRGIYKKYFPELSGYDNCLDEL